MATIATHTGLLHWTAAPSMATSSLPPLAPPLPQLSPLPPSSLSSHPRPSTTTNLTQSPLPTRTQILTIGAGPAGLLTHLLLVRYGLRSPSQALCIDASPHATLSGHADGLFARTLEILRSLGLDAEIEREGVRILEQARWSRREEGGEGKLGGGIKRDGVGTVNSGSNGRYREGLCWTLHQGRVEGVMVGDLARYSKGEEMGVRRGWRCVGVRVEGENGVKRENGEEEENGVKEKKGAEEYPVVVTLQREGEEHGDLDSVVEVRTQYLIAADGAHSAVRRALGIEMVGSTSDDVYGVIDFVPDSDFPDIRRQSTIVTGQGTILHIPREARANGERAVRLYVPFGSIDQNVSTDLPNPEEMVINGGMKNRMVSGQARKDARTQVTVEKIFERANAMFAPYHVKPKEIPGAIEWWAAYRVGQRLATYQSWPPASTETPKRPRVFLTGDAAHTHSPKLGQGMNVSMQDAYNLAWKLSHVVLGLVPPESEVEVLQSYEAERRPVAEQLIDLDKFWYSKRYSRINIGELPKEVAIGAAIHFCSGIGLESAGGTLMLGEKSEQVDIDHVKRLMAGQMRVGCRMPDVKLKRFVDGAGLTLHDECPSTGKWRVLAFTAHDLPNGDVSVKVTTKLCELVSRYVERILELTVLHCKDHMSFEWTDLPSIVKDTCEMRVYRIEDHGYDVLGVEENEGTVTLIRPDGIIALLLPLDESAIAVLQHFLDQLIVRVQ